MTTHYEQSLIKFEEHNRIRKAMFAQARNSLSSSITDSVVMSLITALMANQITSFGETAAMNNAKLLRLRGIGESRLKLIREIETSLRLASHQLTIEGM